MSPDDHTGQDKPASPPPDDIVLPEDAEVLRRMIKSIESEMDRTHIVFIKVLGANTRVYRIGPADRRDLLQLKNLLLPFDSTQPAPKQRS